MQKLVPRKHAKIQKPRLYSIQARHAYQEAHTHTRQVALYQHPRGVMGH